MNKISIHGHYTARQSVEGRPPTVDREACEDLARMLGGIGTPSESHALTARMVAAIGDLRDGCGG